ncbi:thrombospondin type 3 repeat-containing protein, partial [Patescibacteria group bacterium]|nr:thrombospondin type 3 repeat-containing protein [Patescibacteria group bacterium]
MNQSSTKKYMILGAVLSVAVLLGAGCNMPVSLNFNGGENQAGEPAVEEPVETSAQNEAPAQQVPTQQQGQGNQDADGDGYAEPADNCPGVYNPTQQDTDGDGVGDACEVNESAKAACAGSCISSETECYGTGKTIVRDTVCTGANPVCCVTGQVAEPVPTCSGQCIMSETECYGTGKNIVHDTACTG